MLVLSRKPGESLVIGDKVVVTVTRVDGNSVRLGVTAPKGSKVLRDELLAGSTESDREIASNSAEHSETRCADQESRASR